MAKSDLRLDPRDSIDRLEIGRIEETGKPCYVADLRVGDKFARVTQELIIGEDDSRTVVDFVLVGTVMELGRGNNGRSSTMQLTASYPYPDGCGSIWDTTNHAVNYHVWKLS